MSPRRPGLPIGGTGRVTLHEPTAARPYYRLVYLDETGQRQHVSGSRSARTAWNRAQALDARLAGRADPQARTLGDLVAEYVNTPLGRKCDKDGYPRGTDWSTAYHTSVTHGLARAGRSGARPTTGHASRGGSQIRAAALGRRRSTRTD